MRKMPCLFQRDFTNKRSPVLLRDVTPGCEWALRGEGVATIKYDGTACAVIGGQLFKRHDAKSGKPAPVGGIPCDEPDPITGHWPHWIPVGDEPESKWHREAWDGRRILCRNGEIITAAHIPDGTYECCGPKLQGNPQGLTEHVLVRHGEQSLDIGPTSFDGLLAFLTVNNVEGLVFWRERGNTDAPMCKIRRADYGLPWGSKRAA